ncbi:MAG: hypothetical protein WAX69_16450 [Victivallales bacterium]
MNFPIRKLCRGIPEELVGLMRNPGNGFLCSCLIIAIICSSIYGMSVGIWRAPLQSLYVAIKFPLLIVLVTVGNALINSMLAKILGARLTFKESFIAVLMSFAIASVILASFAPLMLCLIWNSPAVSDVNSTISHHGILLFNVFSIAFAGTVSNLHLYKLILHLTESKRESRQIIFSWLAVNLLLGSQLSWIMRPFIGGPKGAVEFLRVNALAGNFFEAVFHSAKDLFF